MHIHPVGRRRGGRIIWAHSIVQRHSPFFPPKLLVFVIYMHDCQENSDPCNTANFNSEFAIMCLRNREDNYRDDVKMLENSYRNSLLIAQHQLCYLIF